MEKNVFLFLTGLFLILAGCFFVSAKVHTLEIYAVDNGANNTIVKTIPLNSGWNLISLGIVEPPVKTIASNSENNCSAEKFSPTFVLVLKAIPSSDIFLILLSIIFFSNLH